MRGLFILSNTSGNLCFDRGVAELREICAGLISIYAR